MSDVVDREAARVLLLDGAGRLLLLLGCNPTDRAAGTWWFTPGGGAAPGESAEQTACRELSEETGLVVDRLTGPVAERTVEFDFDGLRYRQHEHYFTHRLPGLEVPVSDARHTELERRAVLGWRWWHLQELCSTSDVLHPDWLPTWLSQHLSGR